MRVLAVNAELMSFSSYHQRTCSVRGTGAGDRHHDDRSDAFACSDRASAFIEVQTVQPKLADRRDKQTDMFSVCE